MPHEAGGVFYDSSGGQFNIESQIHILWAKCEPIKNIYIGLHQDFQGPT